MSNFVHALGVHVEELLCNVYLKADTACGSLQQFKDIIALQSSYANVYSPSIIYESLFPFETGQYLALSNFTFLPSNVTFPVTFLLLCLLFLFLLLLQCLGP